MFQRRNLLKVTHAPEKPLDVNEMSVYRFLFRMLFSYQLGPNREIATAQEFRQRKVTVRYT